MPITIADLTPESRKALETWAKNPTENLWNALDIDAKRAHNWIYRETIADLVCMARKHNLTLTEALIQNDYTYFPYLSAEDITYAVGDANFFLRTYPGKSYRDFESE